MMMNCVTSFANIDNFFHLITFLIIYMYALLKLWFVWFQARMIEELSMATHIKEMGHNHINHMTDDIVDACAALPVYSWE